MDNFKEKFVRIQEENNRLNWIRNKEEFSKKFGTPDTIIIEYKPIIDFKIWERWNIKVTYNLFGIFPLSTITFGKNLSKKEVEELKVPFAKIFFNYNHKDINEMKKYNIEPSYPIPIRCLS